VTLGRTSNRISRHPWKSRQQQNEKRYNVLFTRATNARFHWPALTQDAAPMVAADSVSRWIARLKNGERSAVPPLLERYFDRLVQLARKRLHGICGLVADEEDVALSAFKSFCLGVEEGRFPQLIDRDHLWRLLAVLTVRKAITLLRRARPNRAELDPEKLFSEEPPAELVVEMTEQYHLLFASLGENELQSIAAWKLEGFTNDEIAGRLGCVERTVERKLQRIRLIWAKELSE
jgi:DNA-directed RNA polymerase specialized sigma24 family protein